MMDAREERFCNFSFVQEIKRDSSIYLSSLCSEVLPLVIINNTVKQLRLSAAHNI